MYLPLIHVPLKLFGDNEPASHSSREMPGAAGVPVPVKSGLPVRRIAAAMTKPRTTTATKQPASNRRQFRCLFFVIRSWNNYRKAGGIKPCPLGSQRAVRVLRDVLPRIGKLASRQMLGMGKHPPNVPEVYDEDKDGLTNTVKFWSPTIFDVHTVSFRYMKSDKI